MWRVFGLPGRRGSTLSLVKRLFSSPRALVLVLPPIPDSVLLHEVNRYCKYRVVVRDTKILEGDVFYDPDSKASVRAKAIPTLWLLLRDLE